MSDNKMIDTSAEMLENAVLMRKDVHTDPEFKGSKDAAPTSNKPKSPAQWAYERTIMYIKNFEEQLDADHEVSMGFAGSDSGVIRIEGLGFYDPDLITFYGSDEAGTKTQLVQHVSQLNVMLRASPKPAEHAEPTRIGFRLASALEEDGDATA